MPTLENVVARLANRDAPRTKATVQAHVRRLLLTGRFDLTDVQYAGELLYRFQLFGPVMPYY